ncbi:MAG: hypothetical protein E7649_05705 [Ruminococcaceae bacterium]|nr:hypothetical protein [Oscillospiraceae bacterium]
MANWNDIKKSIGNIADKTASKTRELADTASLKLKIANKEAERDLLYKALGKLAYAKLRNLNVKDPEALTENISVTLEKLDAILKELRELKAEDEARRAAKEAEKAAKEQAKRDEEEQEQAEQEELNRKVMEDFNAARAQADAQYEKAKAEAENAK